MFEEPKELSWNIGVNAAIPITNGGRLHYDRQQAKIELLRLQEERYNISNKITQQVIDLHKHLLNQNLVLCLFNDQLWVCESVVFVAHKFFLEVTIYEWKLESCPVSSLLLLYGWILDQS